MARKLTRPLPEIFRSVGTSLNRLQRLGKLDAPDLEGLDEDPDEDDLDDEGDTIDPNDEPTPISDKLRDMVTTMIEAMPGLKEEHALFFLLSHPRGRALANHLNSLSKKENPMQVDILKLHNVNSVIEISKRLEPGDEASFTKILQGHAALNKLGSESVGAAFTRILSEQSPEGSALRTQYARINSAMHPYEMRR